MDVMKRVLLAAVLLGAVGCKDAPSEDQCKQLLDHLVELEFKKAGTAVSDASKADLAKQKADVAKAKPEFISMCVDKTAKGRVECALKASTLEAVAKCDEAK